MRDAGMDIARVENFLDGGRDIVDQGAVFGRISVKERK